MLFSLFGFESIMWFGIDTLAYVKYVGDELDVIPRMDWLSANHIFKGCAQWKIVFPNSNELESMSTQQVWSELKKRSSYFIILAQMGVKNEDEISSIHVGKEFMEVFPKRNTWINSKKRSRVLHWYGTWSWTNDNRTLQNDSSLLNMDEAHLYLALVCLM